VASRRGVLVFVLLLAALGTAVLFGAFSLRSPPASVTSPSVLTLDVPATLEESEAPESPFPFGRLRRGRYTLCTLVDAIQRAASDDRVSGFVLHIDGVDWGWAKLSEVRDALGRFRGSGKPIVASLTRGGEAEYFLASAASVVSMPPTASLQFDGLAISALFLRGAFDKFGVSPNFENVGEFKSGVEAYTRTGMSEPSRQALEALLDDHLRILVDSLAAARGMPADSIRRLMDDGPFDATEARARGLIDTLLYDSEADSLAARGGRRRFATLPLPRYLERLRSPHAGPHVALVTASGEIVPGRSRVGPGGEWLLGSETLMAALEQARSRRAVRAIVLRIDSPGGDAQASDEIWHEVMRCRRVKPVIASLSDYAASGGYYIAVGADTIVAQAATVTGSIGIYGGKFNISGLLHKIGLSVETVSRGRHAEMLSPFRDFTPEESASFHRHLDAFYRGFVARVAENRQRPAAYVDSVGRGRVWSGVAARERGLVDALGGLEHAFAAARAKADLPADQELVVERYPKVHYSFFQRMLDVYLSDDDEGAVATQPLPEALRLWMAAARFPAGSALALMPFTLRIR